MHSDMEVLQTVRPDWQDKLVPVVLVNSQPLTGGPQLAKLVSQLAAKRITSAVIDIQVQRWQLRQLEAVIAASSRVLVHLQSSLVSKPSSEPGIIEATATALLPLPLSWKA
jgi:hypothetical protein